MKLGLWFGPTYAASTSKATSQNKDCVMSWQARRRPFPCGKRKKAIPCAWSAATATSLRINSFAWRRIGRDLLQVGRHRPVRLRFAPPRARQCRQASQERAEYYAFQRLQISRIADKLAKACPEAIVDFDVTERRRAVGSSFLSSGRYFLINNGPYYENYDIPLDGDKSITSSSTRARRAPGFAAHRWGSTVGSLQPLSHSLFPR